MKILNKLTNKHLTMNKKRTIVTIIGIMLSTALMCGIGLLISTFREYSIRETIEYNGDYFLKIENLSKEGIEEVKNDKRISSYYINTSKGYFILKEDIGEDYHYTNYVSLKSSDDTYLSTLKLKEGRYPKNDKEVILTEKTASYLNVKVGDTISVNVGNLSLDGETLEVDEYIPTDATLIDFQMQSYKVVGIILKDEIFYEQWYEQGYAFTYHNNDVASVYIKSKSPKKIFTIADDLKNKFSDQDLKMSYNDSLLALYGASKYGNIMNSMVGLMAIVLGLISVGCIIVIYNSFAISVMERKKQFGLFASIGTSSSQLKYTVFYEAFIVGTIGIILGIIASFIGIGTVIYIMNKLIGDIFAGGLKLSVYPIFLILPIVFMIFVVIFSAYSPARKASKSSPIEAIRGNDDIKINKRKIKTSKLTKKIFGIEGEIALKNIKRNKKKYRITIISLVTSIVLFISFTSILDKIINIDSFVSGINYDVVFTYYENEEASEDSYSLATQRVKQIIANDEVKEYILETDSTIYYTKKENKIAFRDDFQEFLNNEYGTNEEETEWDKFYRDYRTINVIKLDDASYDKLKRENHIAEDRPLLLNRYEGISYQDNSRKMNSGTIYKEKIDSISLCDTSNIIQNGNYETTYFDTISCGEASISNIQMIDEIPLGYSERSYLDSMTIFVNEKLYKEIYNSLYKNQKEVISGYMHNENARYYNLYLEVEEYSSIDEYITKIVDSDNLSEYYYSNVLKDMKQVMNLVFVVKLLFYGFVSLVTLIGVTSVFNTLNTSIQLRKKEFAVLRSMGLTPMGLNKMIIFESVFFGVKSLLIGIPISLIFVYLISLTTSSISATGFVIPYIPIFIATLCVFIIVLLTMRYATSKIRHDNILDAIREENI